MSLSRKRRKGELRPVVLIYLLDTSCTLRGNILLSQSCTRGDICSHSTQHHIYAHQCAYSMLFGHSQLLDTKSTHTIMMLSICGVVIISRRMSSRYASTETSGFMISRPICICAARSPLCPTTTVTLLLLFPFHQPIFLPSHD